MSISVKGKFLTDFPEIVKNLDLSQHKDLDLSKIQAGSNKILSWLCNYCNKPYQKKISEKITRNICCSNKECISLKKKNNQEIIKNNTKQEQEQEEWRDLPVELLLSKYQISNLGKIRNKTNNYILTQKPRLSGYIQNGLFLDNNETKQFYIHVLVAKTFIPNPENKPTVNHINKNKSDNSVINLSWATYTEQNYKENKNEYKTTGKSINQYDLNGIFIKKWEKAIDAERELNIDRRNILSVLKGKNKTSSGFIWSYCIEEPHEGEIWKECPLGNDYEKIMASNLGRIKKINNPNPTLGTIRESGYYEIDVYNNKEKKHKKFRVHRLVCMAFIENPENKPFVNHIDENRSNNNVNNLNWMTNKENLNHSLDINDRTKSNKRSKIVVQIEPETNKIIKEYSSAYFASKKLNINYTSISWCCKNFRGQKTAGGFKWEYKA
jgi:hypothetical protein